MTGGELRASREARGWSVPELAVRAEVHEETIRRLEAGAFGGRARTWRRISAALGEPASVAPGSSAQRAARLLEQFLRMDERAQSEISTYAEFVATRGFGAANDVGGAAAY